MIESTGGGAFNLTSERGDITSYATLKTAGATRVNFDATNKGNLQLWGHTRPNELASYYTVVNRYYGTPNPFATAHELTGTITVANATGVDIRNHRLPIERKAEA